jgi:hypothetical protein
MPKLSLPLALFVAALLPGSASANPARSEVLGGLDLFFEDATNQFTNPALAARYGNRVWFSMGANGVVGGVPLLDPHGGGAVRIKDAVTLGVVLNRSPRLYGFDQALWPVLDAYVPGGPGNELEGSDGPSESTAPLRFPMDLFVAIGNPWSRLRAGINIYYAGGSVRNWTIDDEDDDGTQEIEVVNKQTHLWNVALGISGGSPDDAVRPEASLRIGAISAWHDERRGTGDGGGTGDGITDVSVDRILSLDRDLRVGGSFRLHLDTPVAGLSATPALQYDFATGSFRFDDNLVNPDSDAEMSGRIAQAHDARLGIGLNFEHEDLLVHGSLSGAIRARNVRDEVHDDDEIQQNRTLDVDILLPEVALGAEYRLLPALLVRAGVRGTVVGGRQVHQTTEGVGAWPGPDDRIVEQVVDTLDPRVTVTATSGIGIEHKAFRLDAVVGGAFLGQSVPNLFTRFDLGFQFE